MAEQGDNYPIIHFIVREQYGESTLVMLKYGIEWYSLQPPDRASNNQK